MGGSSDFVIENGVLKRYTGKSGDVVIPEGVTEIGASAFEGCGSLTGVSIPEGVTFIGRCAFRSCRNLASVTIPASVQEVRDMAFWDCGALQDISVMPRENACGFANYIFTLREPMIYPQLSLSVIKDADVKRQLALGYCGAPEKYSSEPWAGEYQRYVKSQRKKLLELAEKTGNQKARTYLERLFAASPSRAEKPKPRPDKLSAQEKVLLLEKTVLEGTVDDLRAVIKREAPFEFTARALGYACEYGGVEKVKLLLEAGASFAFEYNIELQKKYVVARISVVNVYPIRFYQMLADRRTSARGYDWELPLADVPRLPDWKRAEIALYLIEQGCPGLDTQDLLFCSVLWGCFPVADALENAGIVLTEKKIQALTEIKITLDRDELMRDLLRMDATACLAALERFQTMLDRQGKKLLITNFFFEKEPTPFLDERIIKFVLERTNTEKLQPSKLMWLFVRGDAVGALAMGEERGWLKTPAQRDKLIDLAMKENSTQTLAWLLDYKNRTADFAAEEAKREKKMMREMSASPGSIDAMKKIWGWKTQEDGTLCLTSYKGTETEVVIPDKIGKYAVTALEGTFSTWASGLTQEREAVRRSIKSVTIPEGVTSVGGNVFFGCRSLQGVTIPGSVTNIIPWAFSGSGQFTIHAPAGSYAEEYAKENNIPFEPI